MYFKISQRLSGFLIAFCFIPRFYEYRYPYDTSHTEMRSVVKGKGCCKMLRYGFELAVMDE